MSYFDTEFNISENSRKRPRLFEDAINALACNEAKDWPLRTKEDVMKVLNNQLMLYPPSADILHKIIDSAVRKRSSKKGNRNCRGFVSK